MTSLRCLFLGNRKNLQLYDLFQMSAFREQKNLQLYDLFQMSAFREQKKSAAL